MFANSLPNSRKSWSDSNRKSSGSRSSGGNLGLSPPPEKRSNDAGAMLGPMPDEQHDEDEPGVPPGDDRRRWEIEDVLHLAVAQDQTTWLAMTVFVAAEAVL